MANNFNLILDTTGPSGVSVLIDGDNTYSTLSSRYVDLTIQTNDTNTTGYQMKIWGDVDDTNDTNIQSTEINSKWISYSQTKQIKLATGDGLKTVYVKLRDDVYNESAQASDSITLDTTKPTVTITGPDVTKISKIDGKDECSFSFTVSSVPDNTFAEYVVKVVASAGASYTTGTQIGTANGSVNMSGNLGSYDCATPITCTINGKDLELASSGDGSKIIKVFVRDNAGNWSA